MSAIISVLLIVAEVNKKDLDLPSGGFLWLALEQLPFDRRRRQGIGRIFAKRLFAWRQGPSDSLISFTPAGKRIEGRLKRRACGVGPALWKDEDGQPWIYVTLWGETTKATASSSKTNGPASHGSVVAFRVEMDKGHSHT